MSLIIGSHVSYKKKDQLLGSVQEALSYGANTFMFYTGAPQNTFRSPIDENLTKQGHELMKEKEMCKDNVIIHAPYIINLASADSSKFDFAVRFLKEEIKRVETLGFNKLVLHPGSHVGISLEEGIQNIITGLNQVLEEDTDVIILLETMAGKGTECGRTFEEIRQIIDGVTNKKNMGVCLDTCHINDSGYNLNEFDQVLLDFDKIIGLDYLYCIHINDSKNSRGSHKDRHENIGLGDIGFAPLQSVIYHNKLAHLPKILETPYVTKEDTSKEKIYPPYKFEIDMIQRKSWNSNLLEDIRTFYK